MRNTSSLLLLFVISVVAGCSSEPDYASYREAIKARLRDPDSAQFRNEQVRTLWTASGKRRTIYCAEVNSNNAFGGKTGYIGAQYFIRDENMGGLSNEPGTVFLYEEPSPNFYMDCIRRDRQRDEELGKARISLGPFGAAEQAEQDRLEPPLSNERAPE